MTRLQAQWHRLYLSDAHGLVRAMVLTLARPADWALLSGAWQGVQRDWGWPAPAIAVNGVDGYQLWFSLQAPVPPAQAYAWLRAVCACYLPEVAAPRIGLWPDPQAAAQALPAVPAEHGDTGQWSAFVAPDLAPMFAETPWLDMPPGADGQADLLTRLASITPDAVQAAQVSARPPRSVDAEAGPAPVPSAAVASSTVGTRAEARRFLHQVMNDGGVALALRIEAAKALLNQGDDPASP